MRNKKLSKNILLVEDDPITATLEKKSLERYGYNVEIADSGENAVKIFNNYNTIDLVLMDINLGPGIDGTDAAQIILKKKEIPVVFLSCHSEPEIVEKTEKITSYGYILKNSSVTVLDASIKMAFKLHDSKLKEKEKEKALKLQRDLGIKLSSTNSLNKILVFCLKSAMEISGLDCGGIYLVNESGNIDLIHHIGLPKKFLEKISHYKADSVNAKIVMKGKPIYTHYNKLGIPQDEVRKKEKLRAMAVLPIPYENKIIACLNLGSHKIDEISEYSKTTLENISTQIGSSILRAKIGNELKQEKAFIDMALDAQTDTFFLFDPGTGKAIRWNKAFKKISGYSDKEIAELHVPDSYFSPEDLKKANSLIKTVLKKGTGTITLELICKNKKRILTEYKVSVIKDNQNNPKYLISIGRNVSKDLTE